MKLRSWLWRHPEWWMAAGSAFAWAALVVGWASGPPANHAHASAVVFASDRVQHWMLMVGAMMLPLMLPAARNTAARSFWRRRHRAVAGLIVGYLGIWIAVGVVVSVFVGLSSAAISRIAVPFAFLATAAWQWAPTKRRADVMCHRTMPLAPTGWPADRDCMTYGWSLGRACATSCGLPMLACALSGHAIVSALPVALVAAADRYSFRPHPLATAAAYVATAALSAIPGLMLPY